MRTQTGNVILRGKVWYVRFYNRDGKRVTQQLEHPDDGPLKKARRKVFINPLPECKTS